MSLPNTTTLPITSSVFRLDVTTNVDAKSQPGVFLNTVGGAASNYPQDPESFLVSLQAFFHKAAQGDISTSIVYNQGLTAATGVFTITSSNMSAGDTVVINGVTFTAESSTPTSVHFVVGASALITAQNLAACVNANSSMAGIVTAVASAGTSSSGVVTFTAGAPGTIGNCVTTTASSTNGSWGAAKLAGGANTSIATNNLGF